MVFYALPEHSQFYTEFCGYVKDVDSAVVQVFYNKWDVLKLERVVGSDSVKGFFLPERRTYLLGN